MIIVTMSHARSLGGPGGGYCARGTKQFFDRNGLDFRKFVAEGIDASLLIATGDAMAMLAVDAATKEANGEKE